MMQDLLILFIRSYDIMALVGIEMNLHTVLLIFLLTGVIL
jgi:hypothetical protein